jgi:hypothetical protein
VIFELHHVLKYERKVMHGSFSENETVQQTGKNENRTKTIPFFCRKKACTRKVQG